MATQVLDPAIGCSTLVDVLRFRAAQNPNRTAYIFLADGEVEASRLTYHDLDRQARAIAAVLQSKAVPGDRALLLYPQGLEYIAAFIGCLYAGIIAVPAYPPKLNRPDDRSLPRIHAILQDAEPVIALTTSALWESHELFRERFPDSQAMPWLATDAVSEDMSERWQPVELQSDAPCFLQYTSGSTSTPKGVMVSHSNIMFNERMMKDMLRVTEGFVLVSWLPLFHDMGLIGCILLPLYAGGECVLMSPMDFLQKPIRWLKAVSRYKATVSGGPNFAFDLCLRKITPEQRAELDLSFWDVAFVAAEPVRQPTVERFTQTFTDCGFRPEAFFPCYGLAEATLMVSGGDRTGAPVFCSIDKAALERGRIMVTDPASEKSTTFVGCGYSRLGQEIAIVDPETCRRCAQDRVGEIWIHGPSVSQGYWNRGEETAAFFKAQIQDTGEGPFLRTGDLGFMRDNELYITGRLKDLIIIDGLNHYPQDIELTVAECHPAIRLGASAAFSADIDGQEKLIVACELERCWRAEPHEPIIDRIRESIAKFHDVRVHDVVLLKMGGIPKTSSGKLQRHACRRAYLDGTFPKSGADE